MDEASDVETVEALEIADEYHTMYPTETDDHYSEKSIPENFFEENFDKPLKKQISDMNREEWVPKKDPTMISMKRNGLKVHEGKKPFLCSICGYATAKEFQLNAHIESVHKDRVIWM